MKSLLFLLALTPAAAAQTLSCSVNGVACQPGTAGCAQGLPGAQCVEVQQPPPVPVAPPTCPYLTYWNGQICALVPQAPAPVYQYTPQYYPQYIPTPQYDHPHNPYWNVPFNQQPGWHH